MGAHRSQRSSRRPRTPGNRLLLCFDGLHEYLDRASDTLIDLFRLDPRVAAPAAIHYANLCGGKDNITALFVELLEQAALEIGVTVVELRGWSRGAEVEAPYRPPTQPCDGNFRARAAPKL